MKELYKKTAAVVSKRQDSKAPDDGEIQVTGFLNGYPVLRQVEGRKTNVMMMEPPEKQFIETEKGKRFAQKIAINIALESMNEVDGVVEKLHGTDSWSVLAPCAFSAEAKNYLESNYKDFYSGKIESSIPFSEYIDREGTLVSKRRITLRSKHSCKAKVSDSENCVFRIKTGNGHLVTPRTQMTLMKCIVEQWVRLQEPRSEGDELTLQAYTTIECKGGVRLSDKHDPNMPLSERYLRQENPHRHSMIPIKDLANNTTHNGKSHMMFQPEFQSPDGSEQGVTYMPILSDNLRDFQSTFDNQTTAKVVFRGLVFQWHNSPNNMDGVQVYSVKVGGYRDIWKSYGIPDMDYYSHIMLANPIWTIADVNLWKNDTLKQEENQNMIDGKEETDENMKQLQGYYSWTIDKAVPNYLRMLPAVGIAVSSAWVKDKFSDFVGTKGQKKDKVRTCMDFKALEIGYKNPLHTMQGESPVVSLGNPKLDNPDADTPKALCHGFTGDFYPRMDKSDFYVLTSMRFDPESEEAALLGARLDGDYSKSEALIDRLIQQEGGVYWWLFAINKEALQYTHDDMDQARPTKKANVVVEEEKMDEVPKPEKKVKKKKTTTSKRKEQEAE